MKSSWKKQRQATKKRHIKMSRMKRKLLKKYGINTLEAAEAIVKVIIEAFRDFGISFKKVCENFRKMKEVDNIEEI